MLSLADKLFLVSWQHRYLAPWTYKETPQVQYNQTGDHGNQPNNFSFCSVAARASAVLINRKGVYMHVVCTRVPDCNTYVCQKEVPKTVFCQWAHGYLFTLFPFSAPHSLPPTRRRMSRFLASRIVVPFVPFSHMGQPRPIRRLLQMPPMGMPACFICSIWVSNHRPPLGMLISFWQPSL